MLIFSTLIASPDSSGTDLGVPEQQMLEKLGEKAQQAQNFYDRVISRTRSGQPAPLGELANWEILSTAQTGAEISLTINETPVYNLKVKLPEALYYESRNKGKSKSNYEKVLLARWSKSDDGHLAFYPSVKTGKIKIGCRVDIVGPVVNYRFDIQNASADTLDNIHISVPVNIDRFSYFGIDKAGGSHGFLERLSFEQEGTFQSAVSLSGIPDPELMGGQFFLGAAAELAPTPPFVPDQFRTPIRLGGDTIKLTSVDGLWVLEVITSTSMSFRWDIDNGTVIAANPGIPSLAPGAHAAVGGIISLSRADH